MPKEDTVLKSSEAVLKPCAELAQPSLDTLARSAPASTEPFATDSRSKSTAESFIIDTWLVSCAASGSRFACASPGSVAAYHGALSSVPPVFEALFAFKGVYRSLTPFESDLVSNETSITRPNDSANGQSLASLQLTFSLNQLNDYKKWRVESLDRKSSNWMNKAAEIVWNCTHGIISKITMDSVRDVALTKYTCVYSKRKVLYFTKGYLKYLTKTSFDTRFRHLNSF